MLQGAKINESLGLRGRRPPGYVPGIGGLPTKFAPYDIGLLGLHSPIALKVAAPTQTIENNLQANKQPIYKLYQTKQEKKMETKLTIIEILRL